ncbi:MAG: molybdenum cofactor biosynthesis protein MoaE [Candidatus Bathyarchaeota archaeon]|nr:molybdenum cofactor biosynthesis protein MoaE [Candidatus Bathyarchaeota archaeon]
MSDVGVHEKGTFTINDLMDSIKKNPRYPQTGGIAMFVGVVRGESNQNQKVQGLTLQAYEERANEVTKAICADLEKKSGITNVQIHHLLGDFAVGDPLVYVSVAGSHRHELFPVLQEAVERYKHEVPIFKKETTLTPQGTKTATWVSEKEHKEHP